MATGARITGLVTRWWWVRHAPVPNPEARCYGQSDKDCDVSNQALFEHQAKLLPKGAVWYASNLLRARKTAEQLAQAGADMDRLTIDPDLAEQHFGEWQGLTYSEIAEKHGSNHLFWLGPRSEEHTSELQSLAYLVCRLLLEKKKHLTKSNTAKKKQKEKNKNRTRE